ncbi:MULTISPECIES: DUF485 domain-containing protein [unclassified Streptomyces]|uniref:DUF485 domain-containing protein n=1 Tax=unclassified Streptomyces TaxID=2593676 RepID=UPI0022542989|nr:MULTISPECIES: DUF485 domain-containing protein [unclassified Streptomyces]MCX5048724.1 DUF485 domain-containing protein [Streptomyces sp. NBC_00474]MCX5056534.1 DUF485 domain-containing protein [Streptomyces sp. NBC_00452]MCX5246545.1 DUF485 domain-containing protein [Streptomyces sp. NBC_00201]MCX5287636.1 DUF485 domain-containing protein [Streptomyces sp. NBC_00183]
MSYDQSPSYPYRHPPHNPPPSYDAAYPWLPPTEPPEAAGRRRPPEPALGHHSDLRILRNAHRWQRRTATLTALGYFTLFLILSAFAPSFMTSTVTDGLPTGLLLALLQIPVTWLAIALYEHTARRYVDPIADRIRKQSELDAKREAAR